MYTQRYFLTGQTHNDGHISNPARKHVGGEKAAVALEFPRSPATKHQILKEKCVGNSKSPSTIQGHGATDKISTVINGSTL